MVEAEKYVTAEKSGDGKWLLSPNEGLQELIRIEAKRYNVPEEKIVEMLFAEGAALVIVEEAGKKQIIIRDPQNHSEKPVKIFNFKETTT